MHSDEYKTLTGSTQRGVWPAVRIRILRPGSKQSRHGLPPVGGSLQHPVLSAWGNPSGKSYLGAHLLYLCLVKGEIAPNTEGILFQRSSSSSLLCTEFFALAEVSIPCPCRPILQGWYCFNWKLTKCKHSVIGAGSIIPCCNSHASRLGVVWGAQYHTSMSVKLIFPILVHGKQLKWISNNHWNMHSFSDLVLSALLLWMKKEEVLRDSKKPIWALGCQIIITDGAGCALPLVRTIFSKHVPDVLDLAKVRGFNLLSAMQVSLMNSPLSVMYQPVNNCMRIQRIQSKSFVARPVFYMGSRLCCFHCVLCLVPQSTCVCRRACTCMYRSNIGAHTHTCTQNLPAGTHYSSQLTQSVCWVRCSYCTKHCRS